MLAAVELRDDCSAGRLRRLAARSSNANQARRLLALAAVRDGMSREAAALIGGMDPQTLRDWVHAFNARGPDGLVNCKSPGAKPKLSPAQRAEVARIVEAGPDRETDVVVRLVVPPNIVLVPLPPKSPELNPVENVWQYLRQTWLSNRVFESYTHICDACCDAWNNLSADLGRIASIGSRSWTTIGQPQ